MFGPSVEIGTGLGLSVILLEERIITFAVTLHRRRMRAKTALHYGRNQKTGNHRAVGVAGNNFFFHNLLSADNDFFRRTNAFQHHAKISPAVGVAVFIGALHMHDGNVGNDGPDRQQGLLGFKRRDDLIEKMTAFGHVAAHGRARRQKRDAHGPSLERQREREVCHIENAELLARRARILNFSGMAEVVGRSHHHIANPGRNYIFNAARADELVKENVRDRTDQTQPALFLADDLMPGGKWNHLLHLQTQGHACAIRYVLGDGLMHGENFGHKHSVYKVALRHERRWRSPDALCPGDMLQGMKRLRWVIAGFVAALLIAWFVLPGIVEGRNNRVLHPPPYQGSAAAVALHQQLLVADLHADSLLWGRNLLRRSATGHVDLPRLVEGNVAIQAFTVVTTAPSKININRNSDSSDLIQHIARLEGWPQRTWNSPKQRALYQAQRLHKFAAGSNGELIIIKSRSDLREFLAARGSQHKVAAFLGAEGTQPLEGKLENLDELYDAGFRMMAPTHFTDTAIGGSASGMSKGGLTDLGRQWVRRMEARNMLIDLAHASPATLADVTAIATRPVIVSHTGVKVTCNNNRNLSDEQLRAVARTGGVIGIGYWETATCGTDARAVARAIRHAVNTAGVEHVALGSDFDGGTTMPFDTSGLAMITDALLREGFSEQDIRKIMGENVVRVLLATLPE